MVDADTLFEIPVLGESWDYHLRIVDSLRDVFEAEGLVRCGDNNFSFGDIFHVGYTTSVEYPENDGVRLGSVPVSVRVSYDSFFSELFGVDDNVRLSKIKSGVESLVKELSFE